MLRLTYEIVRAGLAVSLAVLNFGLAAYVVSVAECSSQLRAYSKEAAAGAASLAAVCMLMLVFQ